MDTLNVMEYCALPLYNFYKIYDVKYIQFGEAYVLSPIALIDGNWYFIPESTFEHENYLNGKIICIMDYFKSSGVFIYNSFASLMEENFSNIDREFKELTTDNKLYNEKTGYEDVSLNSFNSYIKTSVYKYLLYDELLKYYMDKTKETTNILINIETIDVICEYCQTILKNKEEYNNHLENY